MNGTFKLIEEKGIQILALENMLHSTDNSSIIEAVEKLIEAGKNEFIIDLAKVPYMSSSGLTFLISILTRARNAGGEAIIANVSSKIEQILLVTRLNSTFVVKPSIEEAVLFFEKVKR